MFVMDGVLGAAVLVVMGVAGGNWLDEKLHTAPWWSVGLSVVGGGLGLWRLCVKALALDDAGKGKRPTSTGRKSGGKKSSSSTSSGSADGERDASAPRPAYERFTEDEQD